MVLQLPLFDTPSEWTPPSLSELPSWRDARRVSIDTETHDPYLKDLGPGVRRGGYIVGYSFAIEDGPRYYVPIRHQGGDNVDANQALQYLRDQADIFEGDIVGANLSYDLDYLAEEGIWFHKARSFRDIQINDPLINELHTSYSLDSISKRYGLAGKDERLLREAAINYGIDPKGGMWRLPARFVGPYAEEDASQPLLILRRQERIIDERDLWQIYNLESKVIPVLVKMRRRGVKIDQDRLAQVEDWSLREETNALQEVHRLTRHSIKVGDVWKPEAFAKVLEHIGVTLEKTSTGKPSIRKDILEHLDHPVANLLLRARKVNKLRTTFAQSIRRHMTNGRIHCSFNQIAVEDEDSGGIKGARYGRMSCVNPNLQQQPSRDEFASMWRSIYVPDTALWACMDYSQQEPRWLTHYASVMRLPAAEAAAQKYIDDPSVDNHNMMRELVYGAETVAAMSKDEAKIARTRCKIIYLGLCYGEGGAKLCHDLGLPTRWTILYKNGRERGQLFFDTREEAMVAAREFEGPRVFETAGSEGQDILDMFNDRAPFIREISKRCTDKAKRDGLIKTIAGRHCHFPEDGNGGYDWTHKALNRLIQGSSADQTKTAMVALDEAGYEMALQVHDEIDASVESREQAEAMADIMRNCIPASVPFKVDVEIGPSWGEIE